MEAGLNFFSIRNYLQTEKGFLNAAITAKKAGYSYMQYSAAPYIPERIKRVSEESGLGVCLTHVPMDRIIGDTEKLMEEHALFGCNNIGLGMIPTKYFLDENELKRQVSLLNKAGEKMKNNGYTLCYHHHHFEFYRLSNGDTVFDYILKNAPYIYFTADTYWIHYGGLDVISLIKKAKGRIACAHLKDYKIEMNVKDENVVEFRPRFAPVGEGNMDFKAIVPALKEAGAKYFLVEQDDAPDYPDPMGEVIKSINYIKKEL